MVDFTAVPSLPLPARRASQQPTNGTAPTWPERPPEPPPPAEHRAVPSTELIAPPLDRATVDIPPRTDEWTPGSISFEVIVPPPLPPVQADHLDLPALEKEEERAARLEDTGSRDPIYGPPSPAPEEPPPAQVILGPIIDLRAPPATPARPSPLPAPVPPNASVVVDRTTVLPPAGDEERGTFANMLGFGEDEVYFGPSAAFSLDTPTDSYHLAAQAMTLPFDIAPQEPETSEWDELPSLADVAVGDATDTNALVARLWEATADQPILAHLDVPSPLAPNRVLLGSKRWRWSVLGGLVIAVVLTFVAGSAIGRRPIEAARERATSFTESAQRLAYSLGPLNQAAEDITTLDGADVEIGPLIASLDALDGVAREVATLTAEPLPRPALLGSSEETDRLELPQDLLQQAAGTASAVERRLGDALAYRLRMSNAFAFPDLPVIAGPSDIGDIGGELSVALASTAAILAQLPDDAFFASQTESALALLDELQERHVDYLDALRRGDAARAGTARREMVAAIDTLRSELAEPLAAVATWAEGQIAGLQDLIGRIDDELR